jgi:hypothetical protein
MKIPVFYFYFVNMVDETRSSTSSLLLLCVRKLSQGTHCDTNWEGESV